jgi:ubiquinone/menaquinone biosynthesis C-methylase UbiE
MDYDKTAMPAGYDAGRGYSPSVLEHWLSVIAPWVPQRAEPEILDLGCGTGRYSGALAARFHARVTGVEPSENMLAQARSKVMAGVRYERASGEALPLADGSVDMVFMSMVYHHFPEPGQVARECRRVLRPDGVVCLRNSTSDRMETFPQAMFFKSGADLMRKKLPRCEAILAVFASEGFALQRHEIVRSEAATDWTSCAEKISHRADSMLVQIPDTEFEEGMRLLRGHAATRPAGEPVVESVDFFVFTPAGK